MSLAEAPLTSTGATRMSSPSKNSAHKMIYQQWKRFAKGKKSLECAADNFLLVNAIEWPVKILLLAERKMGKIASRRNCAPDLFFYWEYANLNDLIL